MPVKNGRNDLRSVEAEVEVPGSPEAVWQAIATGRGITSWFVPTTVDEGADVTVPMGDQTVAPIRFRFCGGQAEPVAPEAIRPWHNWLSGRFPQVASSGIQGAMA